MCFPAFLFVFAVFERYFFPSKIYQLEQGLFLLSSLFPPQSSPDTRPNNCPSETEEAVSPNHPLSTQACEAFSVLLDSVGLRSAETGRGCRCGVPSSRGKGEKVHQGQPSQRVRSLLGDGASLSLHRRAVPRTPQKPAPPPLQCSSHLS